jgi:uncharacterized protein (TIGR02996 family)
VRDGESLRQAVFNTPWDDALRLVYADWLMEHGDEAQRALGDFIRVSTRMAQKRTRELMDEYGRLMTARRDEWLRHLPPGVPRVAIEFHGGLVRDLRLSVADLITHGPPLAEHYPIDHLRLATFPSLKDAKKLVALPLRWDRIRTLWFRGPFRPPSSVTTILNHPDLVNLIHLRLSIDRVSALRMGRMETDAIRVLADWPGLARLRSLSIERAEVSSDVAAQLFRVPALASVGELNFYATLLDDDAARAILASPFAASGGTLTIEYNRFSEPIKSQLRQRFGDRLTLE